MTTLARAVLVLALTALGSAEPQMATSDGNIIITPAKNKNITIDLYGPDSYFNVGPYDVMRLLLSTGRILESLPHSEESSDSSLNMEIKKVRSSLNRILRKLNRLDSKNVTEVVTNDRFLSIMVDHLQIAIIRIESMLLKNKCRSTPCKNGGTCISHYTNFICLCPENWEGSDCSVDVDECVRFSGTGLGCQNGATCTNIDGSYQCICRPGWHGIHCVSIKSTCDHNDKELCGHGVCRESINNGSFTCDCEQGWTTDGVDPACVKDIDECNKRDSCSANPPVPCINVPGSFHCGSCPSGFTGDGYICDDINECLVNNGGCSTTPIVQCINTFGDRICGPCPPGYDGDGTSCTFKGMCRIGNGGCHPLAVCSEIPNIGWAYVECTCPSRYKGHGYGIDGCALSNATEEVTEVTPIGCTSDSCIHGSCVNGPNGNICVCDAGFSGSNCEIHGIGCSKLLCKNGGTCIEYGTNIFSYSCKCKPGYSGSECQNSGTQCGGFFDSEDGKITYSNENKVKCKWVIKTKSDMVLNLTIDKFFIEDSVDSTLSIHDGDNIADHQLGNFNGINSPSIRNIISSKNSLYILYESLSTDIHNNFSLSWISISPVCGGEFINQAYGSINSPGSPGKYPVNRDCFWTVKAPPGKRILLTFYTLQIKSDIDCSKDYLEIRKESDSPELFEKFCNHTIPPPITSPGRSLFIHFHSDDEGTDYGFQLTFSIVEGIPGCGGVYTRKSQNLSPPTINGIYTSNIKCEYLIRVEPGLKVNVTFLRFELEYSFGCKFDYLAAYDGPTEDFELIGKYCGTIKPASFISTSNTLLLVFKSDFQFSFEGFLISYTAACRETFTQSTGVIQSHGYPKGYSEDLDCHFIIRQEPKKAIVLDFMDFELEEVYFQSSCMSDYVQIIDSGKAKDDSIQKYCGKNIPERFISSSNVLTVTFHSDNSVNKRGFKANYSTIDIKCGFVTTSKSGFIEWPDTDILEYSDLKSCNWYIISENNMQIMLLWDNFDIEPSYGCNKSYLQIKDGNQDLGKFCGNRPPLIQSLSNKINITLVSDFTRKLDTFRLTYKEVDKDEECSGYYLSNSGSITSPGWPEQYPRRMDCSWFIQLPLGQQVQLNIETFSLEYLENCLGDYLEIRNGGYEGAPLIGKFCGKTIPKVITSITNALYLRFVSDGSKNDQGFRLTWESTSTGCGGTLNSTKGTFYSPNYPQSSYTAMECYWKISTSRGSRLELNFYVLNLHECEQSYVEIYNSVNTETELLQKVCGTRSFKTSEILSSSNHVFIKFHSDGLSSSFGFKLNYVSVCDENITGFSGVIESPNFPEKYPQMYNCTWTINVSKGNKINITFSHFELELPYVEKNKNSNEIVDENDLNTPQNCIYDYLGIIDGSSQHSIVRSYCGSVIPPRFTSKGNQLSIIFETNNLLEYSGFRLEWNIVGCGGHFKHPSGTLQTPGYPLKYPANTECKWTIEVEPHMSVKLTILEYNEDPTCYDNLIVYDGPDVGPLMMTNMCITKSIPGELTSSGKYMHVVFNSNDMYSGRGFKATYESVPNKCGGKFKNVYGDISSPKYQKSYENGLYCVWEIETFKHQRVFIEFDKLDLNSTLENGNVTCSNFINIYDGNQPIFEKLIAANICDNSTNTTSYLSLSNIMLIEMITTKGYSKGFHAKYAMSCGGTVHAETEGFFYVSDDMYYIQNRGHCYWTIIADNPGNRVSLTFTYLKYSSKDQSSRCEREKISVYNGESNRAPLIREICGSKAPPTIVSSGNAITVELEIFQENSNMFQVHYSVLATACGGDLLTEHGSFASPMYPDSYPPHADCVWRLLPSPGNRIALSFAEFDVEISENCDRDYVEVREGNATGKILGIHCGDQIPINNTIATDLWVKFHADSEGTSKGFLADYSYLHGNEIDGSYGIITNPMYPKAYIPTVNRDDFFWRISVPLNYKIRITFKEISTNSLDECADSNGVYVHDGYSKINSVIATACGFDMPEPVESSSNYIYITWNSIGIIGSKFKLEWTRVEIVQENDIKNVNCNNKGNEIIFLGQDTIYEMNIKNLSKYSKCVYNFETDFYHHLAVQFISLGSFSEHECKFAILKTRWTNVPGSDKTILDTCNIDVLQTPFDVGNQLKIIFESHFDNEEVSALVYPKCGGKVMMLNGVLTPSFVNVTEYKMYKIKQPPITCEWVVKVRPGRTIQLQFSEMKILNTLDRCHNYVMIRNGGFDDSPYLGNGKYCGNFTPTDSLETTSNYLYVKYLNVARLPLLKSSTFKLKFNEISAMCDYRLTLTHDQREVNISSPNYPNIPKPYTKCNWVIMAPAGERIKVHFIERFDLIPDKKCTEEFVEIRDGGTDMSESLGRFCQKYPPTVKTKDNMVYIDFMTNVDEPHNGFKATISIDECGGLIHATSGSITLPQNLLLANLKSDISCEWTVINPMLHGLEISVQKLDLPTDVNCSTAYLQIVELSPMDDFRISLTDQICKINETKTVTTITDQFVLKVFFTKQTIKHFQYDFLVTFNTSLTLCGGTLAAPEGFLLGPNYRSSNKIHHVCLWTIKVPKGRRITLEILNGLDEEELENDRPIPKIIIYENSEFDSKINYKYSHENRTVESSDNEMVVYYWSEEISTNRFMASYTSEKKSMCSGDFSRPMGAIFPPAYNSLEDTPPKPYYCQYTRNPPEKGVIVNTEKILLGTNYTLTLKMEEVFLPPKTECGFRSSKISVYTPKLFTSIIDYCGIYTTPIYIRMVNSYTVLSILDEIGTGKYTIVYDTFACGGIIDDVKSGFKFILPANNGTVIDCLWMLMPPEGGTLQVSMNNVKLTGSCEEEFLWILDNKNDYLPKTILCSKNVSSALTKTTSAGIQIEYHSDHFHKETKMDIEVIATVRGCGGSSKNSDKPISTPNFPSNYGPNEECIWDIEALSGYRISLFFENRFSIEQSENCSKDFVEIFDEVGDEWFSIGKYCGRNLPGEITSTSNKMKVLFRSDDSVHSDGFQAKWKNFCGGTMDVTHSQKTLVSPKNYDYQNPLKCEYLLKPPPGTAFQITFEKFHLDRSDTGMCESEYITINTKSNLSSRWFRLKKSQTYCGTDIPKKMYFYDTINITFTTHAWTQGSGFIIHYKIEECLNVINTSQKISYDITMSDRIETITCSWSITAPPSMIILLRFEYIKFRHNINCIVDNLMIYDSDKAQKAKTITKLCGSYDRSLPTVRSKSNKMFVMYTSRPRLFTGMPFNSTFAADVIFTYGEAYGCGGKRTASPDAPFNLVIDPAKLYKPSMDCLWTVMTEISDVIRLDFNTFDVAKCKNQTLENDRCDCDFFEVRDGLSNTLIGKYCGNDLPRAITSSKNFLRIRFVTDKTYESLGINATFTAVPNICGNQQPLIIQRDVKELTIPKNPDGTVMKGLNCEWKIQTPLRYVKLRLLKVDLSPMSQNGRCLDDRLVLSNNPIFDHQYEDFENKMAPYNNYSPSKYIYCGQSNGTELHFQTNFAFVYLRTSANSQGSYTGFKLEYSRYDCSRNYTDDYGKIDYSLFDNSCTMIIQTDNNKTISLYFESLAFEDLTFFVKDGADYDSKTIFGAEANTNSISNPIFSTGNALRIEILNTFFVVESVKFIYVTTDKGRGCGGVMHIDEGRLTSPFYPNPYREDKICVWEITTSAHATISVEFKVFDLSAEIPCDVNYVELVNRDGSEIAKYCPRDHPAIRNSNSNYLKITQRSSINNKGSGWMLKFTTVYEEEIF